MKDRRTGVRLLLGGLIAAAVSVAGVGEAHADYGMPTLEDGIKDISAVIDATVVGFNDKGEAEIKVHHSLFGEAPTKLFGVNLTCFGGSLKGYGVKPGARYVFLLTGDGLFEEQSYFRVLGKGASLKVEVKDFYAKWLEISGPRVSRDAFERRIHALKTPKQ